MLNYQRVYNIYIHIYIYAEFSSQQLFLISSQRYKIDTPTRYPPSLLTSPVSQMGTDKKRIPAEWMASCPKNDPIHLWEGSVKHRSWSNGQIVYLPKSVEGKICRKRQYVGHEKPWFQVKMFPSTAINLFPNSRIQASQRLFRAIAKEVQTCLPSANSQEPWGSHPA